MNSDKKQVDGLLNKPIVQVLIFGATLLAVLLVFIRFVGQLDLSDSRFGFDWQMIWISMINGHIIWGQGISIPPWGLVWLLPLGFLPYATSFAIVMFSLLVVLLLSVPRTKTPSYWIALIGLMVSYPTLRAMLDANVDGFVIGGILLTVYAFTSRKPFLLAFGVLLASIKPQISGLLLIALALETLQTTAPRFYLVTAGLILAVVIPTAIWEWPDWFQSLFVVEAAYGISPTGWLRTVAGVPFLIILPFLVALLIAMLWLAQRSRGLSHYKVGLLVTSAMVLSPYTGGLASLAALTLGVIPLALKKPYIGWPLFLLYNVGYLFLLVYRNDLARYVEFSRQYYTMLLVPTWLVLIWAYCREVAADAVAAEAQIEAVAVSVPLLADTSQQG
jgi:hypothetical protein